MCVDKSALLKECHGIQTVIYSSLEKFIRHSWPVIPIHSPARAYASRMPFCFCTDPRVTTHEKKKETRQKILWKQSLTRPVLSRGKFYRFCITSIMKTGDVQREAQVGIPVPGKLFRIFFGAPGFLKRSGKQDFIQADSGSPAQV